MIWDTLEYATGRQLLVTERGLVDLSAPGALDP